MHGVSARIPFLAPFFAESCLESKKWPVIKNNLGRITGIKSGLSRNLGAESALICEMHAKFMVKKLLRALAEL